ncbi:hypothetical protein PX701_01705 [Agromyces sp. H3Y2-19a]|jgi:hypothetical protein|uniref:hypothetical protein n=1 Tax=Agromyces TaxID=33877 RepID=UPI001E3AB831|nr:MULTISPECIES: hypothetical protein [Agromyces]MCD5345959.1 hypothetical protein [Agromyces sp. S2-1-8]MDF0512327.1 hypothetical protein [Agromyces chromiiresistens]
MTNQLQTEAPREALDEPCPRCGSAAVRAIVYGPLDLAVEAETVDPFLTDDAPIFDCRDCGFEWGLAVRDLLA